MAENQKADNFSQVINEAIDIHVQNAVRNLQFDKTEIAEIVDITNRENGDYVVYNGSAKYHAYTENTSYALGTKVYVNIPNNDTSLKKTIIRKYSLNDDNRGLNYILPLDRYDALTGNILDDTDVFIEICNEYNNETGKGLLANYDKENKCEGQQEVVLYKITNLNDNAEYDEEGNEIAPSTLYQGYQYLGLSAKFKTLLSALEPAVGNFGLKIKIDFHRPVENTNAGIVNESRTYVLDTQNMIGSLYNFMSYFEQQALFELPEVGNIIDNITVSFFQDGNFKTSANKDIPTKDDYGQLLMDNILVKDIDIRFGNEKDESAKIDQIYIYSPSGITYDGLQLNDDLIKRKLVLKWSHRDPDSITDEKPDGELELMKSVTNIPNDVDLTFKANIWWLYETTRTWGDYTDELNSAQENDNDRLKAQKAYNELMESYHPETATEEEKNAFAAATSNIVKVLKDAYDLQRGIDYSYDGNGTYSLLAAGETKIKRNTTQIQQVNKAPAINSEWVEGWLPVPDTGNDAFSIYFTPDKKVEYARVRCIVEYGPWITEEDEQGNVISKINRDSQHYVVLKSNIFEFRNMSYIPDLSTWDASIGLSIQLHDNSKGVYPLYNGNDGKIFNAQAIETDRIMEADIVSSYSGISYLNGQESLIWKIPKAENSMIRVTDSALQMMNGRLLDDSSEIFNQNNQYHSKIGDYDSNFIYLIYDHTYAETDENGNTITNLYHKYTYDDAQTKSVLEDRIEQNKVQLKNTLKEIAKAYNISDTVFDEEFNSFFNEFFNTSENNEITVLDIINNIHSYFRIFRNEHDENIYAEVTSEIQQSIIETLLRSIVDAKANISTIDKKIAQLQQDGKDIQTIYNRLTYRIAEYYKPNLLNNTVYCYLIKNGVMVETSITLTFSQHGTAGTDYTFTLSLGPLVDKQVVTVNEHNVEKFVEVGPAAAALTIGEKRYRQIIFNLYDANDEVIELTSKQKNDIISKWVSYDPQGFFQGYNKFGYFDIITLSERVSDEVNDVYYTDIAIRVHQIESVDENNEIIYSYESIDNIKGIILKATLSTNMVTSTYNDRAYPLYGINFVQYLPLAVRTDDKYFVPVANTIYYGDDGANPRYSNNEIILTINGDEPYIMITKTREIEILSPEILIELDSEGNPVLDDNENVIPILDENGEEQFVLDDDGNIQYEFNTITEPYEEKNRFYEIKLRRGFGSNGFIDNWGNEYTIPINGWLEPIGANGQVTIPNNFNGLPALTTAYKIVPYPLYVENASQIPLIIEGYDVSETGSELVYATPLLILQNTYQIPALNSWNGNLLIDEDNNRVMAATVAAGNKDNENRFTGVIMGDVESEQNVNPEWVRTQTGLYGYHEGAQSFGFKDDGTAFIGKSGTGRILFDGTTGVIQSASRSKVGSGMKIDLDDGILDIENTGDVAKFDASINKWIFSPANNNEKTKIKLQAKDPYFEISVPKQRVIAGTDEYGNRTLEPQSGYRQSLIKVGNDDYFLQTANYDTVANTGLKIDLQNGTFDSRGRLRINGALESEIRFGDTSNYLKLGIDKNSFSYFDLYSTGISDAKVDVLKNNFLIKTIAAIIKDKPLIQKYFNNQYKDENNNEYNYVGQTLDGYQVVPHTRGNPGFSYLNLIDKKDENGNVVTDQQGNAIKIPSWIDNGYYIKVYDTESAAYTVLKNQDSNCAKYNSEITNTAELKNQKNAASVTKLSDIERVINHDFDVYIQKLKQKPYNDSQSPLYEDKAESDKIIRKYWVLKYNDEYYDPVNNHRYGSYNRLDYWFNHLMNNITDKQKMIKEKIIKSYSYESKDENDNTIINYNYPDITEEEYEALVVYNIHTIQNTWTTAQDEYKDKAVYKNYIASENKVNELKTKAENAIKYCVSRDIAEIVFGVKLVEKKTQKSTKTYWEYAPFTDVKKQYAAYVSDENPSTEKIAICKQINSMIEHLKEIEPNKIISIEKLKKLLPAEQQIDDIPQNTFNDIEIPSINTRAAEINVNNTPRLNGLVIILIQRYLSKQFSLNTSYLEKAQKEENNLEKLRNKLLTSDVYKNYLTAKVTYETMLEEAEKKLAELNEEYNALIEREDYKLYLAAGEKLQDIKREGEKLFKEIQNLYNEYDIVASRVNNTSNNSTTNHSIRISNSRQKRIEIGDNFWVKDDGEVLLSSLSFKKDDGGTVSKIHPQWKGFVTDITGDVELRTVGVTVDNVTCYVDVKDTYTTVTHNIKQQRVTTQDYVTIVPWTKDSGKMTVYDSVETIWSGYSPDGTYPWYKHTINFPISIVTDTWVDAGTTTDTQSYTTTRQAKGTGTGHTDVPVVTGINLNVSKIYMWALTNKDDVTRTYSIDAKKKGGSYGENKETPNSDPFWDNKDWDSDIDS